MIINNVKTKAMEDYEIEFDATCPKCNHSPLHSRTCQNWCDDGIIEEFLDDIEIEGLGYEKKCPECKGTGVEWWCPNCGENLSGQNEKFGQDYEDNQRDADDIVNEMNDW